MSWQDTTSSETAAQLRARLVADGFFVNISDETGSVILYHNGSSPLKQGERNTCGEYRGLTEAAARKLVDLTSDDSTTVIYYAQKASGGAGNGKYVACAAKSGSVTTYKAVRNGESLEWICRVSTVTYSATGTGWSTTKPSDASTGIEVSKTKTTWGVPYGNGLVALQHKTVTETEYQFLTYNEAVAICTSSDTTITTNHTYTGLKMVYTATNPAGVSRNYTWNYTTQAGTNVSATMKYVDEVRGWTVNKTTTVIS